MPTHTPLSDAAWAALLPHLPSPGAGRPIPNLRARFDAIFAAVTSGQRWSHYTAPGPTPTDTLHRHFRRLAHAGLWSRLLSLLAAPDCPKPLQAIAHALEAAHRRTIRLLGLPAIILARRLQRPRALPAAPWMLPDPDLSETCQNRILTLLKSPFSTETFAQFRIACRLFRTAGGRARIPARFRTL